MRQRKIETKKALCIPITKDCMMDEPRLTLVPTNNLNMTARGKLAAAIARESAKLVTIPACRKVARVAEAIPRRCMGEAFIAALVLGA